MSNMDFLLEDQTCLNEIPEFYIDREPDIKRSTNNMINDINKIFSSSPSLDIIKTQSTNINRLSKHYKRSFVQESTKE